MSVNVEPIRFIGKTPCVDKFKSHTVLLSQTHTP